jgi:hypothetical protein
MSYMLGGLQLSCLYYLGDVGATRAELDEWIPTFMRSLAMSVP